MSRVRPVLLLGASVVLIVVMYAVAPRPSATRGDGSNGGLVPNPSPSPEILTREGLQSGQCGSLRSDLIDLLLAPDPLAYANFAEIPVDGSAVRLEFATKVVGVPPDGELDRDFGVRKARRAEGAYFGDIVIGWVPVHSICRLGRDLRIVYVQGVSAPRAH